MNVVFADTSFYIALLRLDDDLHSRCIDFDRTYAGKYLTSEFILVELGNWLAETRHRALLPEISRRLRGSPTTEIIPATADWVAKGMTFYSQRLDKQWSFTDCISFEMMRYHGVIDALTADRHFTQAGFRAVLA